jgi:hypothetical protein
MREWCGGEGGRCGRGDVRASLSIILPSFQLSSTANIVIFATSTLLGRPRSSCMIHAIGLPPPPPSSPWHQTQQSSYSRAHPEAASNEHPRPMTVYHAASDASAARAQGRRPLRAPPCPSAPRRAPPSCTPAPASVRPSPKHLTSTLASASPLPTPPLNVRRRRLCAEPPRPRPRRGIWSNTELLAM